MPTTGSGRRPSRTCTSASTSWTRSEPGSQDLAAGRDQLPRAGRLRERQERLTDSLREVYGRLGAHQRLVLEYKLFEPAFYSTDVPDWGTAYVQCLDLGDRAVVCLDTGHHAPGTNIEFIVAQLLRLGRLGSFDFNSRFYADDDLIVGAADPFQLFRILYEVVRGGGLDESSRGSAFMLDQCHNIEEKIPGQIRSVLNVQEMLARALLVDRSSLAAAQRGGDVLGANEVLMDAFYTDVRPVLAGGARPGVSPPIPWRSTAPVGYAERIVSERIGGIAGSAGAPEAGDRPSRRCWSRSHRLGADPQEHQLRRRQHLGQGDRAGPRHREARSS